VLEKSWSSSRIGLLALGAVSRGLMAIELAYAFPRVWERLCRKGQREMALSTSHMAAAECREREHAERGDCARNWQGAGAGLWAEGAANRFRLCYADAEAAL
jgi:hypothetical protein